MHDDLSVVTCNDFFQEGLDLVVILLVIVHLPKAIAYLMPQQITALLSMESSNERIDSFLLFESFKAEKRVDALGDGCACVLECVGVLVQIGKVDYDHVD